MVPGAGLEPARYCYRGILNPLCLPISPPGQNSSLHGGWSRNRTGVHGVAVRCMTTLPSSQSRLTIITKKNKKARIFFNNLLLLLNGHVLSNHFFKQSLNQWEHHRAK